MKSEDKFNIISTAYHFVSTTMDLLLFFRRPRRAKMEKLHTQSGATMMI